MGRKFRIQGKRVELTDRYEETARAKYLRGRAIGGSDYVVTDFGLYRAKDSATLRAEADAALLVELEASLKATEKP